MTTSQMSPEQIEQDITRTREELRQDVDALQEKLSPTHAARRGAARVGESVTQVRDTLMGTAQESVSDVSGRIGRGTRGNPIAVGLGAFALGWFASSLIPASRTERQAAESIRDSEMASAVAQPLAESAKSLAGSAEASATEAAREVGREAKEAAHSVAATSSTEMRTPGTVT
jgi:hypothetical protein